MERKKGPAVIGNRSQTAAGALIALHGAKALGWLDSADPEQIASIEGALTWMFGVFAALKAKRMMGTNGGAQ